ncbi:hypothetical protein N7495_008368 [Penicillium taxi]|uniref:uncharacterized protein n=1 Tax=Penicillium taxi TaxID=168475 RepID=UPI00254573F3|nr:uncharacterized protein N7495_008368 [Penicillium taxi]KAJ5888327.1 hypothetical protein N7495_008368 [Penicillium taxi]
MAPFVTLIFKFDPLLTSDEFRAQWVHPADVFSVLDVVARALAQLAGQGLAPVIFSFGWVVYSVSALVSAIGENKLMLSDPDCKCKVINCKNGDPATKEQIKTLLDDKKIEDKLAERPTRAGLVVTVYKTSEKGDVRVAKRDFIYWSGIFTLIVQLGVAVIPCGLFGDWGVLMITAIGNALAFATGLLPQWKKEKWACRDKSPGNFVLTRGNGAQHSILILGNRHGLTLEDLALWQSSFDASTNLLTRVALLALSTLWMLLITAAGLQSDTWFLLAVSSIGIVQDVFVAGWDRKPENFGITLEYVNVFGQTKVIETLYEVERDYRGVGVSMRNDFFPGKLYSEEVEKWDKIEADWKLKP